MLLQIRCPYIRQACLGDFDAGLKGKKDGYGDLHLALEQGDLLLIIAVWNPTSKVS
jgi:hypothetical protein